MKKISVILLCALVVLCVIWEVWLAPLQVTSSGVPRSAWLALKGVPLMLAVQGFRADRLYTYKWMSLAIWLYFMEGVVRGYSDRGLSSTLAWIEAALSLVLFIVILLRVKQLKKQ